METFSNDLFKMVETWLISGSKRKVVGVTREVRIRVWVMEGLGYLFLEKGRRLDTQSYSTLH